MYREKSVGVVVPAYNEEELIIPTLKGVPDYVDWIVVVDDCSQDRTSQEAERLAADDPRIILIRHEQNRGVGGAISSGYVWCRDHQLDIAVVMAGDNQMDPVDMPNLLDAIVDDKVDYAKGNRLFTGEAWKLIPRVRYLGNAALSFLTKIASGYWHIADSQTGYTAINRKALQMIPLEDIYPRYGMPNDLLVTLNIYHLRVKDVPVRPVYKGEKSGINFNTIVFTLSALLVRLFLRRMVQKYVIRDFHPLILFYLAGFLLLLMDIPLGIRFLVKWIQDGFVPSITFLSILFCTISGLQLSLFGMLFDMEANRDLKGS